MFLLGTLFFKRDTSVIVLLPVDSMFLHMSHSIRTSLIIQEQLLVPTFMTLCLSLYLFLLLYQHPVKGEKYLSLTMYWQNQLLSQKIKIPHSLCIPGDLKNFHKLTLEASPMEGDSSAGDALAGDNGGGREETENSIDSHAPQGDGLDWQFL